MFMYNIISSLFSKKYFFSHTDPHNNTCMYCTNNIGFFWKHFLRLLGGEVWWIPKCYFFTALKSDNAHIFVATFQYTCHVHTYTRGYNKQYYMSTYIKNGTVYFTSLLYCTTCSSIRAG